MGPPRLPADTGDARGSSTATLADVIYGVMSVGGGWSERKTPQQGFPLDMHMKGSRRHHLFSRMCLDFCLSGEIQR